jgi:hypothetical protein
MNIHTHQLRFRKSTVMYQFTKNNSFEFRVVNKTDESMCNHDELSHVLFVPDFLLHQTGEKDEIFNHFTTNFDQRFFDQVYIVQVDDPNTEQEFKDVYSCLVTFVPRGNGVPLEDVLEDFDRLFKEHANGLGHVPLVEIWEATYNCIAILMLQRPNKSSYVETPVPCCPWSSQMFHGSSRTKRINLCHELKQHPLFTQHFDTFKTTTFCDCK